MNILTYDNYRQYLEDYKEETFNSYKDMSLLLNLKSESYLIEIINANKNLSTKTAHKFTKALGFNFKETSYFLALMKENDTEHKLFYQGQMKLFKNIF